MYKNKKSYLKRFHPLKIIFFIGMGIVFMALVGTVVMLLWNSILPKITGFKAITFWEALGIFLLFRILFGSIRHGFGLGKKRGSHRKKWKEKWKHMTEEDKENFKQKWQEHCNRKKNKE